MIRNRIHPGEFLQDELQERSITMTQLADHNGVAPVVINFICNGKRGISPEMAKKLAVALGTTPQLWMNLQVSFDPSRAPDPDFERLRV